VDFISYRAWTAATVVWIPEFNVQNRSTTFFSGVLHAALCSWCPLFPCVCKMYRARFIDFAIREAGTQIFSAPYLRTQIGTVTGCTFTMVRPRKRTHHKRCTHCGARPIHDWTELQINSRDALTGPIVRSFGHVHLPLGRTK
jgi:hypothetical protein